jgi:hypothetical protein
MSTCSLIDDNTLSIFILAFSNTAEHEAVGRRVFGKFAVAF